MLDETRNCDTCSYSHRMEGQQSRGGQALYECRLNPPVLHFIQQSHPITREMTTLKQSAFPNCWEICGAYSPRILG